MPGGTLEQPLHWLLFTAPQRASYPRCPLDVPWLQASVRWEAERALEPLRRLPQLLSQAMPVTPEVLGPAPSVSLLGCACCLNEAVHPWLA